MITEVEGSVRNVGRGVEISSNTEVVLTRKFVGEQDFTNNALHLLDSLG